MGMIEEIFYYIGSTGLDYGPLEYEVMGAEKNIFNSLVKKMFADDDFEFLRWTKFNPALARYILTIVMIITFFRLRPYPVFEENFLVIKMVSKMVLFRISFRT
jgi:hypothetical protein